MGLDWDTEVSFSYTYTKGAFGIHLTLLVAALLQAINAPKENHNDFYAEFGKIWTESWYLSLLALFHFLLICYSKRKHCLSPTLPNEIKKTKAREASGSQKIDFTRGSLLRRIMQRVRYCKMKLSPLQYVAKGLLTLLCFLGFVTYIVFCFGAPLNFFPFTYILEFNSIPEFSKTTIAFCLLMTILTGLPIILVYSSETIGSSVMYVFFHQEDQVKANNEGFIETSLSWSSLEPIINTLYVNAVGAFAGAWFGAFPIPLDWDRPWQEWPISCNIGITLGAFLGNCISLYRAYQLSKNKGYGSILTSIKTKKS